MSVTVNASDLGPQHAGWRWVPHGVLTGEVLRGDLEVGVVYVEAGQRRLALFPLASEVLLTPPDPWDGVDFQDVIDTRRIPFIVEAFLGDGRPYVYGRYPSFSEAHGGYMLAATEGRRPRMGYVRCVVETLDPETGLIVDRLAPETGR